MIPLSDDNPTVRPPVMTVLLLVAIAAVWVLVEGAGFGDQMVRAICNLGLEQSQTAKMPAPEAALIDHDLVTAFEAGWSVLYRDVSLVVAGHLASMLTDLECLDSDVQQGLEALRRSLTAEIDAGTPWLARDAAEVLAQLDVTAWIAVLGLLDECPVVPAALTAILEGRTTAVSATAFDFISTTEQIGDVRRFLQKLADLLSR